MYSACAMYLQLSGQPAVSFSQCNEGWLLLSDCYHMCQHSTRKHLSHRHHHHHLCSNHRNRDYRHKHNLSMVSTGHIWLSRGSMIARQKFECKIASLQCAGKNSSAKRLSGLLRLQVSSWNSSWVEIGLHVDMCIFKIVSRTNDSNGDESGFQQPDLRL